MNFFLDKVHQLESANQKYSTHYTYSDRDHRATAAHTLKTAP